MFLKVNLQIFLLSEREGKHNSFSMVDLPGKKKLLKNIKVRCVVVLCCKNFAKVFTTDARNRFLTG